MENVNWLSLLIATIIPMVVGFIYYHKAVFGNAWMDAIGMTEEKAKEANMGLTFGLSFVMAFMLAFFMLNFVNGAGQEGQFDSFKHGCAHGLILTLFVVMPIFVTNGLFEQKKMKGVFINIGYWLVTLVLMGGVLDLMNNFPNDVPGM